MRSAYLEDGEAAKDALAIMMESLAAELNGVSHQEVETYEKAAEDA